MFGVGCFSAIIPLYVSERMIQSSATTVLSRRCQFPGISFVLVCALAGTLNFFSSPFSVWVANVASFPEEEEVYAKDRSALVSSAQHSRRGTIRPKAPPGERMDQGPARLFLGHPSSLTPVSHRLLTGAGIVQLC